MDVRSRITGGTTTPLFQATVLGRHKVSYYRCDETGFIQTEQPYWLEEAYQAAITALDVGLVRRNLQTAALTKRMIDRVKPNSQRLLDYGGGTGLFVRLMRDEGYPFLLFDKYCENQFAVGFSVEELTAPETARYQWLTAWEVFEHLIDPMETLREMFAFADRILFSTILVPDVIPQSADDWWYFTPETGQHVSFFSRTSLQYLAKQVGVHFYSDDAGYHLFSREELETNPLTPTRSSRIAKAIQTRLSPLAFLKRGNERESLIERDYQQALFMLRSTSGRNTTSTTADKA